MSLIGRIRVPVAIVKKLVVCTDTVVKKTSVTSHAYRTSFLGLLEHILGKIGNTYAAQGFSPWTLARASPAPC